MNFYLKENIFFWTEAFLEQNFKLDLIWYFNWREVDFFAFQSNWLDIQLVLTNSNERN